jgi:hypothetical protein
LAGASGGGWQALKSSNRFELPRLQSPADTAAAMAAITAAVAVSTSAIFRLWCNLS